MGAETAGGSSLGLHANGEVFHNGKMIAKFEGKFEAPAENPKVPLFFQKKLKKEKKEKEKRDKAAKKDKADTPSQPLLTPDKPKGTRLWGQGCTVSCAIDTAKDGGVLTFIVRALSLFCPSMIFFRHAM